MDFYNLYELMIHITKQIFINYNSNIIYVTIVFYNG